jgi:dihydroorotase
MKLIIHQAQIADPASPLFGSLQDLLIENGIIQTIAKNIEANADMHINMEGLVVSPGWLDPFAHCCDPGFEYRETLETGAAAAAGGAYTDIMVLPNTNPVVHSKSQVEYIRQKNQFLPATLHPIGAVTKNAEGTELAEMYDMRASGALAFSDGLNSIQSPGIMVKALQYVKAFDGTIIQLPGYQGIGPHGLMNEGIMSMRLGMPGKPAMAEELMVSRDIELVKYTGSRIHFTGISTARSLALIQQAKEDGLNITCSVTPYHLFFCDEDLASYDTNLKVNPPLRTIADRQALRDGLIKGWIDCIASHHIPHNYDHKVLEFEYAKNGMTGLETGYAVLQTLFPQLSAATWVNLFCTAPRRIFGLEQPRLAEGATARISLFQPGREWTVDATQQRSKSRNTAFDGKTLLGKPAGTILGSIVSLTENKPA